MKLSKFRLALFFVLAVCTVFALCACDECAHTDLEVVKTESTCTTAGEEYLKCHGCGIELKVGDLELKDHDYKDGACTMCGEEDPDAGCKHHLVLHEAKDPTCSEIGWAAYEECTKCDYTTYLEYDALEHTPEVIPGKDATCEETGYTESSKCAVCSEVLTEAEEIPALGHDEVSHEAKKPTCTEIGWDEYVTCSRCEYTTYNEKSPGHVGTVYPGYEATCTDVGFTDGVKCEICDTVIIERKEIPALGHDEVVHPGYAATCTEPGLTDGTVCDVCGEVLTECEEIPALGHDEVVYPGYAATCTEVGFADGVKCEVCDTVLAEREEIPALGHDEATNEAKAPTCTEIGWDEYVTCSRCDYSSKVELPALGHDEVVYSGCAATCTEVGFTDGVKCEVCDTVLTEREEIPALGHKYDDDSDPECNACGAVRDTDCEHTLIVLIPAKAPTCTDTGLSDGSKCKDCGIVLLEQTVIDALGHDEVKTEAQAPGCTEAGWSEYVSCSRCDYNTKEEIDALGHDEVKIDAKAPTCTSVGWDEHIACSRCDYNTAEIIPALGHTERFIFGYDATCTSNGLTSSFRCTVCKEVTKKSEVIPALGHEYVLNEAKAPTCISVGWNEYTACSRCNDGIEEKVEFPATGVHEWLDATCANPMRCANCDAVDEEHPALNHPHESRVYNKDACKTPSCRTEPLYYCENESCVVFEFGIGMPSEGECAMCKQTLVFYAGGGDGLDCYDCTACGEQNITEVLPALDHSEAEELIYPQTCLYSGFKANYCEGCGKCDYFEVLPQYSHEPGLGNCEMLEMLPELGEKYTCETNGYELWHCHACEKDIKVTLLATGHYYVNGTCIYCSKSESEALPD